MSLAKKLIYPPNLKRVIFVLVAVIAITTITMGAVFDASLKSITLVQIDEVAGIDNSKKYSTRKATVAEFFAENEIVPGDHDVINMNNDDELTDDDVLIIRKGRQVELTVDGNVEFAITTKATVGDALSELSITLSEEDVVTPDTDEIIYDGMSVVIDRYVTETITETQPIEFETKKVNDSSLASGKTKVTTNGVNGEKEITYTVVKKNGEVISKEYVSEKITKEPVTKVIKVGTKKQTSSKSSSTSSKTKSTSSSSKNFSYSRKFDVTATAYSSSLAENGGNTKTAYGLTPQFGVVAVDPKVIPLGTRLYIESSDGGKSWTYGYCIAGDTGGAIKGNKVDLCFETSAECRRFGRKSATVYVLN